MFALAASKSYFASKYTLKKKQVQYHLPNIESESVTLECNNTANVKSFQINVVRSNISNYGI